MNKNLSYFPPLHPKKSSTKQDEKWDESIAFFNNGQFEQVVPTLLDYIDSNLRTKKKGNTYEIAHGSVLIFISQSETDLIIKCPFLTIEDSKKVPLMRRLAEMRMYPLNLANLVLEGEMVFFTFSCPLQLCEPYKIYGVLREICLYADSYDDELIEKFSAAHLQEPSISPFPDNLKEEAFSNSQSILSEGLERFNYYMEKRQANNAWYTLNITFKKLEFYSEPQGYLRTLLEKAVNGIQDRRIQFQTRLLNGKSSLEKLKNYPKEKFLSDLYQVETFVPHKYSGKKENIRENWEDSYNEAQEKISNYQFEDACNLMQSCFYGLFYYNLVNESISKPITDALAQASQMDWNLAAPILMNGMESIMEDSLFGDEFGMDLSKIMGSQMQESMAAIQQMMANFKTN
ncbi:type III secretion system chaperone family protein [Echinicola salinicaeni]|uniref:hypothetical protein n=1 Tax=Echinicola salinicaeni TaxID=2762757 RepID=UPI001644FB6C|nr:hypothetical protein [Echinicola salinicaeni]